MSYVHENYNMITDKVAIGNHLSSYEPFDVIVNLCFPENRMEHRQILISQLHNKTVITVGIHDSPDEDMLALLIKIMPHLVQLYRSNPNMRILFHCYAGVSRSSSVAIAYLMVVYNFPLRRALEMAQTRRPIVKPNPGFIKALQEFEQKFFYN